MAKSCGACAVRTTAICSVLDDGTLAGLAAHGLQRRLARGETLERRGDAAQVCANLQSGLMKIASVNAEGDESIVGLAGPGDLIGQPFGGTVEHDLVALTDVTLCVFPQAPFAAAMAGNPAMGALLLRRMIDDLATARRWLVRLGRASAVARVAGLIADIAARLPGAKPGAGFDLPLSRGEIADLLGLTIETVSRQMTRLRAAGVIDLPGGRGIAIRDADALAIAAEARV
ncbi:hypothetical protein IP88_10410 [alpha proteobacterium AAP81b]|nr:hypothetical protein IP88_10410 [alpha proteobacterium AAP81b]